MSRWIRFFTSRTVWVSLAAVVGVILNDVYDFGLDEDTIDKAALGVAAIIAWLLTGDISSAVTKKADAEAVVATAAAKKRK